jgi:hypothetical protein
VLRSGVTQVLPFGTKNAPVRCPNISVEVVVKTGFDCARLAPLSFE